VLEFEFALLTQHACERLLEKTPLIERRRDDGDLFGKL
jgi:hypothetical protein